MVNWTNLLSGNVSRRKVLAAGGAALGAGAVGDELLNDGNFRKGAVETGGNWWEEIVEDPMGLNVDSVNEYNEAVNEFEENFEDEYLSEHHQARGTENVGRVPSDLKAGDTLDDEQYAALGFNSEDINNSDGNQLIDATFEDNDFAVLTPDAVRMADADFGDEFGAIGINKEDNEFDASDLVEMRNAYRDAAEVAEDWIVRTDQLRTEGQSLDRLSTEYEDEEEIPAVQQARDNNEYLGNVRNNLVTDHLRFRAQANLFDHALQNTPYSNGDEVGHGYDEEETETPTDPGTETPGEHDEYGDISEYCDFSDQQIDDLNEYMQDNNIESYDEFDVDVSSTRNSEGEATFTVELAYDGETISMDNVEGCGA